jgi:ubiquinone/menaquinone biosynthesis C-methylase UbiE
MKEDLKGFYNTIEGDADEQAFNSKILVQRYFQRRKTEEIKNLLKVRRVDVLLDIGCGSGVQIRELGGIATGVDINQKSIDYANSRNTPNAKFIVGDATKLPVESNSVNKVVCAEIVEHLPDPDKVFEEILRVLKPCGKVVITTPNDNRLWGIYEYMWDKFGKGRDYGETHISMFTQKKLHHALMRHGFHVIENRTIFFIAPIFALSNQQWLLNIGIKIDRFFERRGFGVSIVCYAEKKNV